MSDLKVDVEVEPTIIGEAGSGEHMQDSPESGEPGVLVRLRVRRGGAPDQVTEAELPAYAAEEFVDGVEEALEESQDRS